MPPETAPLELLLLGSPAIVLGGQPLRTDRRKATALLTYLAVTHQPHQREALATLLWPEYDQARAHANLRRVLWVLNDFLGKRGLPPTVTRFSCRRVTHSTSTPF